jgi:hypothetical protein
MKDNIVVDVETFYCSFKYTALTFATRNWAIQPEIPVCTEDVIAYQNADDSLQVICDNRELLFFPNVWILMMLTIYIYMI